ncbi:MAG: beta-propeller domain-containing protein [Acidimicrobiales bacterium]|nr:beta-propeller domain-containing protein [Acidimicrobiales bacterium]
MVVAVAATLMLGAACSSSAQDPSASGGNPIFGEDTAFVGVRSDAPTALQQGQDCGQVLEDFQSIAEPILESQFGFFEGDGDVWLEERVAQSTGDVAETAGDDAATAAPGAGDETGGTSDTNVQEEGIDEPDTVETDGDHVYVVDQQELVILDGDSAEVLSRTQLASHGAQILLEGDRLLALSGGAGGRAMPGAGGVPVDDVAVDMVEPARPAPEPAPEGQEPIPTEPTFHAGTVIQLVDVADRTDPEIVQTTELEGNHVDTRVVDGVARVVLSSYPEVPALHDRPVSSQTEASERVDDVVADTTVDDWLPAYRTTPGSPAAVGQGTRSVEGTLVECEDVLVPEVNAGIAETSVLRVGFEDGFDPANTTTVVAEAGSVYASSSTLYITANRYVSPQERPEVAPDNFSTAVHAFDLSGDGAATHLAAGEVAGHTLNQYSMSEYEGHLRIATTEGTPWAGDASESVSGVHVFRADSGELVEVGSVGGLGRTETIHSVRFMGPTGYVVTFRQTDPLYVIDLTDPANPQNVGELKIPGFSSYLHPIGDDQLIGVGRDADLEGRDRGLLLSLFDASDPTNPKQLQTWTAPDAWSTAGNDPQAFLWWEPETAAILPLERHQPPTPNEPESNVSGIALFDVTDDGITERATVTADGRHPSRALVVQGRLWSLFDGGVVVSDFDTIAAGSLTNFR